MAIIQVIFNIGILFFLIKFLFKCILKGTIIINAIHNSENISTCETENKFVDIDIQTKLTKEELDKTFKIYVETKGFCNRNLLEEISEKVVCVK